MRVQRYAFFPNPPNISTSFFEKKCFYPQIRPDFALFGPYTMFNSIKWGLFRLFLQRRSFIILIRFAREEIDMKFDHVTQKFRLQIFKENLKNIRKQRRTPFAGIVCCHSLLPFQENSWGSRTFVLSVCSVCRPWKTSFPMSAATSSRCSFGAPHLENCFNGLCTPFGSPVIGGQKRIKLLRL